MRVGACGCEQTWEEEMGICLKGLLAGLALSTVFAVGGGAARAAGDEIVVGAPISLTGSQAGDGQEEKWAYEQAVADINKTGGVTIKGKKVPVRLVIADDESSEGKVAAAVENLVKAQKVDILLSTHSGPMNLAGAIVAEKYKKFYMITTAFPFMWQPYKFKYSALFLLPSRPRRRSALPDMGQASGEPETETSRADHRGYAGRQGLRRRVRRRGEKVRLRICRE
jgi:branched-chain amino acid transport system substrate-binding protein